MRVLITGGSGQVGGELARLFPGAAVPGRGELDLRSADSIREFVRVFKPELILNPGAYTAVDKAESEPEIAAAVNAAAPGVLGEEAVRLGARVVHFSTDYVFDGRGTRPYVETDATGPVSVYGQTKLAGEQALAASGARYVTLRTSWVYGATGRNFLATVLRVAAEREEMRIVADQHGAPTEASELARVAAAIVAQDPEFERGGLYHATGAGETTWFGFADEIVRLARERWPEKAWARMVGISTSEYPTAAVRPENSRLDCRALERAYGLRMASWQETLAGVVESM